MSASTTLVTGGSGYLGVPVVEALLEAGRTVRILDVMLHGQHAQAEALERRGADVVEGDVRDPGARNLALEGVGALVHLAAVVGDPACASDPDGSESVNVDGTLALVGDAAERGVERVAFASTCSNYGRMSDPTVPIGEDGVLAPVSLYARQKVAAERWLLSRVGPPSATCLRFATIYGVAPRMRFDLTVNEFTRELWADRALEIFGEQAWRPYVHVRDAARAVRMVLDAPLEQVAGRVFNVGRSSENYRKSDLVRIIQEHVESGSVSFVQRDEDPRDYRVAFERIADELGFTPVMTVRDGVVEVTSALDAGRFGDPFHPAYQNLR